MNKDRKKREEDEEEASKDKCNPTNADFKKAFPTRTTKLTWDICEIFKLSSTIKTLDLSRYTSITMSQIKTYNEKLYNNVKSRDTVVTYGEYNTNAKWSRSKEYVSILAPAIDICTWVVWHSNTNNLNLPKWNFWEVAFDLDFSPRKVIHKNSY